MKETVKKILRIPAAILGVAFVLLSIWMVVVAADLYFFFYSALVGALLLRYAFYRPKKVSSEIVSEQEAEYQA